MDFEKWARQKTESISEKINNSALKRDKVQMLTSAAKAVAILYVLYIVISAFVYPAVLYYIVYKPIASDHIDAYLNKTSETILLESTNNTEITDNIVRWELNEFIFKSGIFDSVLDPFGYRIPKNAGWYIYLNKGNCGERATIFNDMASRTGLSYRKIVVDGFINSKYNSSSDHSWSEVLLEDGSWVIADSGFNISPLHNNKSVFCSEKNMLLGPVFVYENHSTVLDCTDEYVDNTEKIKIKVLRDRKTIDNANIKVTMNYNGVSKLVAGGFARFIKFETNESGM
ncbi:transglutaminase-like domain-containing protein [Methanolobus psychrotolerans]|uniref:transglutaminase-like domain-containing protein n=1 Tax=Methanolobus psychrotolerans TaxID=1874706 RepID=UPI00101ADE55|nr:transglutaminase-like domain-containing protein [Methanolobus psychrotolerans]